MDSPEIATVRQHCECMDIACRLVVGLSLELAQKRQVQHLVLIVKGCARGPEKTDVLVGEHEAFSLYRDGLW